MPETSTPTLTPDGTTKFPAFQNNNPGNVEVDALKAYILSQAGLANGLATLDENGKLNSSQIPVNLDDVLVYASYASLPATGETGKLYITMDVNGTYYWNGTSYQILNQSFVRYRGSLSSLPSDPQPGDWFIAASSFSSYTSGHIYLYNGSSWDDVTAVFGQFVLKTDIAQTLGQQIDKVPSNKAVDDAINAIMSLLWTNPNPSASFEGQSVGINTDKTFRAFIIVVSQTGGSYVSTNIVFLHEYVNSIIMGYDSGVFIQCRTSSAENTSTGYEITFGDCSQYKIEATSVNSITRNERMIPQRIYGVK